MRTTVAVQTNIDRSARVVQVESLFDVPPTKRVDLAWSVDMPIEERPWNVGLIVGPSGCGKSTVARNLFAAEMAQHDALLAMLRASGTRSLLDTFPAAMPTKEVVGLLSSVGFSSPPAWVRPFNVLSNGEQFRVSMAAALAHSTGITVVDEFTSVVDRTVAQIGANALAKQVRRAGKQFIAVTCHGDVEEWLQPEWVYYPAEQRFAWRLVQPRPQVRLTVHRCHHSAWARFRHHHYLSHELNKAAICFVAYATLPGRAPTLVAFDSWLPMPHVIKNFKRTHRLVCLPDYQGLGIAQALNTFLASMWRGLGFRPLIGSSHPAVIASRMRDTSWRCTSKPQMRAAGGGAVGALLNKTRSLDRNMASFEYVGPAMDRMRAKRIESNWTKV